MNRKEQINKKIEDYFDGDLSPAEIAELERRIAEDPEVRDQVTLTGKVITGIRGFAFKQMLKEIHKKHFGDGTKDATDQISS